MYEKYKYAEQGARVTMSGRQVARIGDSTSCGAIIVTGSSSTFGGSGVARTAQGRRKQANKNARKTQPRRTTNKRRAGKSEPSTLNPAPPAAPSAPAANVLPT